MKSASYLTFILCIAMTGCSVLEQDKAADLYNLCKQQNHGQLRYMVQKGIITEGYCRQLEEQADKELLRHKYEMVHSNQQWNYFIAPWLQEAKSSGGFTKPLDSDSDVASLLNKYKD